MGFIDYHLSVPLIIVQESNFHPIELLLKLFVGISKKLSNTCFDLINFFQLIFNRIQELLNEDTTDCGRIPRTLECELLDDLVDTVAPGENIIVSGTLHVLDSEESNQFIVIIKMYFIFRF